MVPGWTAAGFALQVVQGILPLAALYLTRSVINTITAGLSAADKGPVFSKALLIIGLMAGVGLLQALIGLVASYVGEAQSRTFTDKIQDVLLTKSIEADLQYYENPKYFDTLHRAQGEGSFRPTAIVNGLSKVAQTGVTLVAIMGLLLAFRWDISLVIFAAVIPGILMRLVFARRLFRRQREWTASERRAWYYSSLMTGEPHAKEIRLFNIGPVLKKRYGEVLRTLRREKLDMNLRRSKGDVVGQASALLAVSGSLAFIVYKTVHGALTLGDMVMYYQAFQRGQSSFQGFLGGLAGLYEDNLFLSNLFEFLNLKPKVTAPSQPRPIPQPMKKGLMFDRVSFRYPGGREPVLQDVSLTLEPGKIIALVGENGAGKTTLVKLLCRLYDPSDGKITLDGIDLREFDPAALKNQFTVIFQDYARYYLSARENIWLGNVGLPADDPKIVEAAKNAGVDEAIRKLPQGYETNLGKLFEEGEEISVGEWQKIALARAFLRDAPIIVLDEPTSSLDARAEYEIFEKFRRLAEGRSAVLISHRFSTVRMADYIYVIEAGKASESGTHDELVRRGGAYARLFEYQARNYQ